MSMSFKLNITMTQIPKNHKSDKIIDDKYIDSIASLIIDKGDCVIDIGFNFMQHTKTFLKLVGVNGYVIGFEPIDFLYDFAKKFNFKNGPTFIVYNIALGKENVQKIFRQYGGEFSALSNYNQNKVNCNNYKDILMSVQKLDNFKNDIENLKFIKIDAEGSDLDILIGAEEIIRKFNPVIIIEFFNDPAETSDLTQYLQRIDYTRYNIMSSKRDICLLPKNSKDYFDKLKTFLI